MSSTIFFFIFILFLAFALLSLNLLLAPHSSYNEKDSSFECGFSSFLYQNRSQFSISFFLFALLFLIFDLEIVLIYPYVVSAYNNSIYGLVVVLIFLAILTAGFVYEIGRGALKIHSRQSNNLNNISIVPIASLSRTSSFPKGLTKLNLTQRRLYSTKSEKYQQDEFFKQIARSLREGSSLESNNPFIIANSFLKRYPNFEIAKDNVNFEIIHSILSKHINNFNVTESEFEILRNIIPKRFELPIREKGDFIEIVGKYARNGKSGRSGVYVFINKKNEFCYIGSSVQLANRLARGYLGSTLGNRKINLVLKELGLNSFYLDIYVLPENLINALETDKIKHLTLFLEQYFILCYNPVYNILKVAGSSAGRTFSPESIEKMKIAALARDLNGENNPMFGKKHSKETLTKISASRKGRKLSDECKAKLRIAKSGKNHHLFGKTHSEESKQKNLHSQSTKKGIEVTDLETKNITLYPSIRAAARAISCRDVAIHNYFKANQQKPYRGRYVFKLLK